MSIRRQRIEGSLLASRYFVGKQLSINAGVASYEARDMKLGRSIVLKLPYRANGPTTPIAKRLMREAKAAARIDHPNVLASLDFGELADGTPYIITEGPVGENLRARIAREQQMAFRDLIDNMTQILSGLAASHEGGYTHGSLTSEQVHLASRPGCAPLAKLLGVGGEGDDNETPAVHPRRGGRRASSSASSSENPRIIPRAQPRNAGGKHDVVRTAVDPAPDIYACGALLFEMSTGKPATGDPSTLNTLRPGTPATFTRIVTRAMSADPMERFQSIVELHESLRLVVGFNNNAAPAPPMQPDPTLPDLDEWDDTTNERPLY